MSSDFIHASDDDRFVKSITDIAPHAFLVGTDVDRRGNTLVTAHVMREYAGKRTRRKPACFRGAGVRMRIKTHRPGRMAALSSLADWAARFSHQTIISDPTGVGARTAELVGFAGTLRAAIEQPISGIYWNGEWRTIYVVLDDSEFVKDGKLARRDLARVESAVQASLDQVFPGAGSFQPVVRMGFEAPGVPVVPVDTASDYGVSTASFLPWMRRYGFLPALGAVLTLGAAGAMADDSNPGVSLPAVSAPNGKIAVMGGYLNMDGQSSEKQALFLGSYAVPVSKNFGFQIDGLGGFADTAGELTGGVGAHLFWRDPSFGLFGISGGHSVREQNSGGMTRTTFAGAETELYLNEFTFAASAGQLFGTDIDNAFQANGKLLWYATDDFMISAAGLYNTDSKSRLRFGTEYQPAIAGLSGLSVFADGGAGQDNYVSGSVGLRFYFGESKTLKHRHRQDDPTENVALAAYRGMYLMTTAAADAADAGEVDTTGFDNPDFVCTGDETSPAYSSDPGSGTNGCITNP